MKKIFVILCILLINSSCVYYSFKETPKYNLDQVSQEDILGIESETLISLFIGVGGKFSLFGYGPPNSLITLSGIGLRNETYSENNGYFEFKNQYLPLAFTEPCVSAQDQLGRISMPVCIIIPKDLNTAIGPVLLPPTISVDKSDYFIGDDVILTGQTIPGSTVDLSMFADRSSQYLSIAVYALTIPKIEIKTDKYGNYSLTIPSADSESFRVFAQSNMNNDLSPKSNTMRVKILPIWMLFVKFLYYIWAAFKEKIVEIVILSQIIALVAYLFRYYFHPHKIALQRAIILRKKSPLMIVDDKK
jgi:hypothetical protein